MRISPTLCCAVVPAVFTVPLNALIVIVASVFAGIEIGPPAGVPSMNSEASAPSG